ncbi:30S ribosomal protein S2 [Candidatus Mycoplasma haematolamae str. Purdue]|uniref:Small ribosomal subunit protein uS2 n=1 Tax=Mycoplasma haematolamae (strain Purdue) TaxID=1212765 RepID=I7CEN8_MYCHA|nr:30S ribosomal protein S2 [Candidatus Mycoplasma haematolamae]AFO51711.1 30S ribosomal protein S2 [Candidatus Mycoplasma haematolamae str. Purdue]
MDSLNKRQLVSLEKMVEFDLHMGARARLWDPRMSPFLVSEYRKRHVIDLEKTAKHLEDVYSYLFDLSRSGLEIMFVSSKNKIISEIVKESAKRVNAFYITQRWLGGLLTNFKQVNKTLKMLTELDELLQQENIHQQLTKKEISQLRKKKSKIERDYDGIKGLSKLPNVLVVFNPINDLIPIQEARKMDIPVVGIVNSNNNPEIINFAIPANNFSPKSVYLLANLLCDAIAEAVGQETLIAYKDDSMINLPKHLEILTSTPPKTSQ